MAQAFLERTFGLASLRPTLTRSESVESSTTVTTATSSSQNRLSHSSTPPTSAADSESVASSLPKDIDGTTDRAGGEAISDTESRIATPTLLTSHSRPRRSRASVVETYNVKILSGTSVRASKKLRTEAESPNCTPARQRTIGTTATALRRATPCDATGNGQFDAVSTHSSPRQAVQVQRSNEVPPKGQSKSDGPGRKKSVGSKKHEIEAGHDAGRATRSAGGVAENLVNRLTVLGKRGRDKFEANLVKAKRELMRLADTNEFAKVETKPVVTEVWSKGKLVTGDEPPKKKVKTEIPVVIQVWSNGKLVTGDEPPKKKVKTENVSPVKGREEDASTKPTQPKKKGPKVWLNKGLYAGQDVRALDWFAGLPKLERKRKAVVDPPKPNKILPMPMWHGQRLLHTGRDFKLPFDICSPLPPGQPKPDEWRKVPKNRFVGDAAAAWKKTTVFDDFSSRCVCSPENGCDDSCQNRIMLYECDDGNCSAGRTHCTNRAFTDLQERRSKGGKYRIGVEVIKTEDRGYGVRTNRCFEPHQIIVEYTGEIITEEECDRRMNEDYKDNECYYLMLFDQNMIIDATRGSIARFVNHSCEPNCRMVKWIVAGKPRMALFAGDKPIMTGDELTYDYNFDPFSAKNVQVCRCGSERCRGVLGPRPKDKPKAAEHSGAIEEPAGQKSSKKHGSKSAGKGSLASRAVRSVGLIKGKASSTKLKTKKSVTSAVVVKKGPASRVMKTYSRVKSKLTKRVLLPSSTAGNAPGGGRASSKPSKASSKSTAQRPRVLSAAGGVRTRKPSSKGKELQSSKAAKMQ